MMGAPIEALESATRDDWMPGLCTAGQLSAVDFPF